MGRFATVVVGICVVMGCSTSGKKAVDVVHDSGLNPDVKPQVDVPESGLIDIPDGGVPSDAPLSPEAIAFDDIQNKGECCDSDDDCTSVLTCIGGTGEGMLGTCQHKPNKSVCYSDETCPAFHKCVGAQICTCDMNCMTEAGTCTPVEAGCCTDDAECPAGTQCVGGDGGSGICLIAPNKDFKCWTDSDCGQEGVCVEANWCECAGFCGDFEMGYCQEEWLAECVAKHSGCECYDGCADGFSTYVYYPDSAGEFAEDISPPQELLDVAFARYDCGVCSCTESWQVPMDGEWVDFEGGPEEFCIYLKEIDGECGGCLVEWFGGCC
jgi:hypothetical protein